MQLDSRRKREGPGLDASEDARNVRDNKIPLWVVCLFWNTLIK